MSDSFSDEQAKAILARAIELDSRAHITSRDDLRQIALDLDISPDSLEAALREHATALGARRTVAARRAATALAGVGIPLGIAVGSLFPVGVGLVSLGLMGVGLVASGGLVILEGAAGTPRSFHIKNLALWAGVAGGTALSATLFGAGGPVAPMLIAAGWCVRSWVASSILGSAAMIAVRRAMRLHTGGPGNALAETLETGAGRRARLARRVLDWFTPALRRVRAEGDASISLFPAASS